MSTEKDRFIHVSADADDNLRIRRTEYGDILEQKLYANIDENGNRLEYPESKWFPVKIVDEIGNPL